ncbi:MAG TPA: TIGR04190 family B12-binding domain/radical SAM domain protein [Acidocella sp.]|nr:MAG: B12-binding domain/radical SAM domain protein [Rhodospirillales bacterium 20-58-10]HQT37919.1 TIGR04190 family B12-binding domain/radical SAM domain protein [Acidocella sp.]
MADIDLLLLHPPSVYDFRKRAILYGPVSDLIPSSTVFEMYPLGFLTMASYLQARGLKVRIVNLALRMMKSDHFDVARFLAKLKPAVIGIDLHWLPHCHGALEIARIAKQVHPNVPVLMGGLSSTYYHEELITYPDVDYVLRGDSTEAPLHQLLLTLRSGGPLAAIPNLTWKQDSQININPLTYIPDTLDNADLRPDQMVEMAIRYRDTKSIMPFDGWTKNPITVVFSVKGCSYECVTCGSSQTACSHVTRRKKPVFRSPASMIKNMQDISRLTYAPIFIVGDLLQGGPDYAREILIGLREAKINNEIVFEFFTVPPLAFLEDIAASVRHWSIEFSPESHDQAVREAQGGEGEYDNATMEAMFTEALRLGCSRLDIFFMIGLPTQTHASVMASIDYCEHLFSLGDPRLSCFISPMGPFIDPGSRGFEDPERFGYVLFARTLEEHRQLLLQRSWEQILNYATIWMTRAELVDATYDAGERLNALKMTHGRISRRRGTRVAQRLHEARELRARLDQEIGQPSPSATSGALEGEIARFSTSTICDKRELFWPTHLLNFKVAEILRIAWRVLWH